MDSKKFLSDIIVYSKYAKYDQNLKRRENWSEIIQRNADMHARKYPQLANEIYDVYANYVMSKKVFPSMRSLQFAGKAIEVTPNRIFNCFAEDVKFITANGTKSFTDFSDGDVVSVPTHTGNFKDAIVKSYGKQELYDIEFVKGNTSKTVRATANHRWLLSNGEVTTKLSVGDKLISTPVIMDFDYDLATPLERVYWAYGYIYGDGTVIRNKKGESKYSMIHLCDKDRKFASRFEELGFKTSRPLSAMGDFFAYTGTYKKTPIDIDNETHEHIKAFVAGYLDADAYKNPDWYDNNELSRYKSIQASDDEHIKFIRDAFGIAGVYIQSENDLTGQETNYGIRPRTIKFGITTVIGRNNKHNWSVKSITKVGKDVVWCLEVEDDHSFILDGGMVTGNCAFSAADHPAIFSETMFNLLGGCGVGISVQQHHIEKLPPIQKPSTKRHKRYLIPDSIEGWAEAIKVLMKSYFNGSPRVIFDYSDIRPKGTELVTAGGKAPGPTPLKECVDVIVEKLDALLEKFGGEAKLTPLNVHDLICHISDAVLAGGIRRSALISLFSLEDKEMLNCKSNFEFKSNRAPRSEGKRYIIEGTYNDVHKEIYIEESQYNNYLETHKLPWYMFEPQRGRANNSVVLEYDKISREDFNRIWKRVEDSGCGEPGVYWTNDKDLGANPCCFIGDTKVKTIDGYKSFAELCDKDGINLVTPSGEVCDGKVWKVGDKPTVKLTFSNGSTIECTADHKYITEDGREQEAKDLKGVQVRTNDGSLLIVSSISDSGTQTVYDFNIDSVAHHGIIQTGDVGTVVHNCEISLKSKGYCVASDTKLITKNGLVNIGDVTGETIDIWNGEKWSPVVPVKTGENQELYRVKFSDGSYLDATGGHKFLVKNRFEDAYNEVTTLDMIEMLRNEDYAFSVPRSNIVYTDGISQNNAYELGFFVGDGSINGNSFEIALYGDKVNLSLNGSRGTIGKLPTGVQKQKVTITTLFDFPINKYKSYDGLPVEVFSWNKNSILNFVAGWADADGSQASNGIRIYGKEKQIRDLQLLLTKCGINSSVNKQSSKGDVTNLAERKSDVWYVQITKTIDIPCHRLICDNDSEAKFKGKYQVVKSVTPIYGLHDSFCFEETERHQGVFNNVLTKQCNLTEIVADGIDTQEEFNARAKAAAFLGTLQAGYTNFHYLRPEWQDNAEEDALLGVSMTGISSGDVFKLDIVEAAKCTADENERVAELIGTNKAKRITTVKPSGCMLPKTEIKTNKGIMSLQEIFDINDIDIDAEHLGFFKVKEDIKIYDENDEKQPITALYVNGKSETFTITFEDGSSVTGTGNHKLKTSNRGWVRFDELTEEDDIISF